MVYSLLQLWPWLLVITCYNRLFQWDYTLLKWGDLVLITGKGRKAVDPKYLVQFTNQVTKSMAHLSR